MSQFTKKAIADSFIKLLSKTPLDKITVKDIVEDCGVNRNTFYYYYQDVYDLLRTLMQEEAEKVITGENSYSSWQEGFLQSTKFAMENKQALEHLYHSIDRELLERYLYDVTDSLMMGFVKQQAGGLRVDEEDIRLIADFYKCALVGLVLEWIRTGMKDDSEIFIKRMGQILDGNIRYALENCVVK